MALREIFLWIHPLLCIFIHTQFGYIIKYVNSRESHAKRLLMLSPCYNIPKGMLCLCTLL